MLQDQHVAFEGWVGIDQARVDEHIPALEQGSLAEGAFFRKVHCQKNVGNPNHHYFSKKYRNTPPIRIAIRLPFVSQYFWKNLGGRGRRDVPHIVLRF